MEEKIKEATETILDMESRIKIPKHLQNPNFRFILIIEKTKKPFENNWQTTANYKFDDEKLIKHLAAEGNYGVVGGYGNLLIIDIDKPELAKEIAEKLNTFTVKTGSGGMHFYVLSNYRKNHVFHDKTGEIRANHYQVVGPGSVHPNGNVYQIINNTGLLTVTQEQLFNLFGKYIDREESLEDENDFSDMNEQVQAEKEFLDKKVIRKLNDYIRPLVLQKTSAEDLKRLGFPSRSERDAKVIVSLLLSGYGKYIKSIFNLYPVGDKFREHPNPDKYLEYQVKSSRKYSGVFNDEITSLIKEIETIDGSVLRNKLDGYINKILLFNNDILISYIISTLAFRTRINKKDLLLRIDQLKKGNLVKTAETLFNITEQDIPEVQYLVNPLLPKNSLVLIGGKPGQFKSMFALTLAISLRNGDTFLNSFKVIEKPKILYYDLENSKPILHWRSKYICNGMKIETKNIDGIDVFFEFNKNDIEKELEIAKNYDVIFLDSYRRFLEGSENDSDITDKFFKNFLYPLRLLGKTIIILHHFKKTKLEDMSDEDIMDLFRGSGDIPAQFDLIYGMFKSDEAEDAASNSTVFSVSLVKVKNRLGLPIKPSLSFNVKKDDSAKAAIISFDGFTRLKSPKERHEQMIVDFIKKNDLIERKQIIEFLISKTSISEPQIDRYLKELLNKAVIFQGQGQYGKYTLKNPSEVAH